MAVAYGAVPVDPEALADKASARAAAGRSYRPLAVGLCLAVTALVAVGITSRGHHSASGLMHAAAAAGLAPRVGGSAAVTMVTWHVTAVRGNLPQYGSQCDTGDCRLQVNEIEWYGAGGEVLTPLAVNASGSHPKVKFDIAMIMDGNPSTKFVDDTFTVDGGSYIYFTFAGAPTITGFKWLVSDKWSLRDPISWTVEQNGQVLMTAENADVPTDGWTVVWPLTPPVETFPPCETGYELKSGDVPGWGKVGGVGGGVKVGACADCAALCDGQAACNSYECSARDLKCNLNEEYGPTTTPYKDYMFCSAMVCPPGYESEQGDVPGWGKVNGVGGGVKVGDCQDCAGLCDGQLDCNSYECSPTDLKCNLNEESSPTVGGYKDYMYCSKSPCPTGYVMEIGDVPGWGGVSGQGNGELVADAAACTAMCDSIAKCNSVEYSPTSNKCNLNEEILPTAGAYQDYAFCSKGLNNACPSGYTLALGDIPGWGSIAGSGGGEKLPNCGECADLCSSINDCESYECSPTSLKCNLNTLNAPTKDPYKDYLFCAKDY